MQTESKQEMHPEVTHDDRKQGLFERLSKGANGLATRSMSSWYLMERKRL